MPPAAAPPPVPAPPALARTNLQFVEGTGATLTEARWTAAHDSPLVDSLVFLPWDTPAPPARTAVKRSSMVGAILMAIRAPMEAQRAALQDMPFLTHEFLSGEASTVFHEFDKVGAFDVRYATTDAWVAAMPGLWAKLADINLV